MFVVFSPSIGSCIVLDSLVVVFIVLAVCMMDICLAEFDRSILL